MNNTPMAMGANPTLEELQIFLTENFDFRYNVLTDMPECKPKNTTTYRMIDKRTMNSLSYKAMMMGIECKDADVKRFLFSDQIATHHPFQDYMASLPEWDGTDRVTMLAARVSGKAMWLNGFHRWMLGMVAQWLGYPARCANALAPILISAEQGMCKSTFCSIHCATIPSIQQWNPLSHMPFPDTRAASMVTRSVPSHSGRVAM